MTQITMTINGELVSAEVEPRTSLADFLRDDQRLTGTHLGCEHGVCGACTVMIDGMPQRSCIAFAATCDGSVVRTIEDFDDDDVMADLRDAFTAHLGVSVCVAVHPTGHDMAANSGGGAAAVRHFGR